MSLQVTVTDNDNVVWTGSLDEFEAANRDGISEDDFNALWDHGEIDIGGGAAPAVQGHARRNRRSHLLTHTEGDGK
jgi:hypothetical protein